MTHNDLTGQIIGRYKVLEYIGNKKYRCQCRCSNIREVRTYTLTHSKEPMCEVCRTIQNSDEQREKLEGRMFGKWLVKDFLGNHKYRCICTVCNREFEKAAMDLKRCKPYSCCRECSGMALENIEGQVFGSYKAIKYVGNHYWECECLKCGNKVNVTSQHLRSGGTTQCKQCYIKEMAEERHDEMMLNWKDKKFGILTPVKYYKDIDSWLCKCDCGKETLVKRSNLLSGHSNSCGCKTVEFKNKTMLERYGDIASKRIGNPRGKYELDTLYNKDKFTEVYNNMVKSKGRRPTSFEIASELDITHNIACKYTKMYDLDLYDGRCSSQELDFIDIFPEARVHNRKILSGDELDFYFENKKLAVEINGDFWHSTLYKDKYYHQRKTIECAKQHIQLIHIFEHEWYDDDVRKKLISLINRKIHNENIVKIYGRDTNVKTINYNEAKKFLETYHLQCSTNSSINIGCYYKDKLIGVMTFGFPRFNNEYQYELHRLCWKDNTAVLGGLEKMFSYFKKTYNPTSIITYCDISKFTGNSYLKIGFKPIQPNPITEPNYIWVSANLREVIPRYQTQKHKLVEQGLGTEDQTEDEIMMQLRFFKIYNSGNIKLEWLKENTE